MSWKRGPNVPAVPPSDAQAREKLALYVYEYLLHIGAKNAAQTFLQEIRWDKQITLGDPPGFLCSWWCVFWDLYCAAPERRDSSEHSNEAKAFHDYGFVNSGYAVNGIHGPVSSQLLLISFFTNHLIRCLHFSFLFIHFYLFVFFFFIVIVMD
ncbi:hypothetical protein D917_04261 [Trichinella nativa]|uniref:Uncharacterized protein n=1 Tax=Trichinella nativa TaxID=6335 RepID=A0A1Y3EAN1_9BILA|nr:hypothetical protein D917_04261 [Trichinella nativa]